MAEFHIPDPLPPQGYAVPVNDIHASFKLFGFLPIGNSYNSINSRLVLYTNRVEVKIMRADYYPYKVISRVDYLPARLFASAQVVLELAEDNTDFFIYLASRATEISLIRFLQAKGIPLSNAAQERLTSSEN